jgi:DNA-binding transcriptional LysR family regulator
MEAEVEFRHLKMFVAVAESGSFTGAAARIHNVQSNVTMRIKELETELQQQLFVRQKSGVLLTAAGRVFLGYAQRILQLADEGRDALRGSALPRGALRLGSMETTAAIRLPNILALYHEQYPEVELSLQTGTTAELIKAVENNQLDGAFVRGQQQLKDLHQTNLFHEELVLATHRRFESLEALSADFSKQPVLVFRTGCFYRSTFESWLHEAGLIAGPTMEFGTLDGILSCVAAGMGMTLLPRSVIEAHGSGHLIRCHQVPTEHSHVTTAFIRSTDRPVAPALAALISLAHDQFSGESGTEPIADDSLRRTSDQGAGAIGELTILH